MTRRRPRPTDPEIRYRNMLEAEGRPALAGLSRIGFGSSGSTGLAGSTLVDGSSDPSSSAALGCLLVLATASDSIAAGGDYIEFDTIEQSVGFDGTATPQSGYWQHPFSGVYALTVEVEWDTFTGGGTIELEVDGLTTNEGVIASGSSGKRGRGTIFYVAQEGTAGRVKVTQDSGGARDIAATAWIAVTAPTDVPVSASWELVFSADAWDITNDGTHWYVTEGPSGETVTKRTASGTVVDTFEATTAGGTDDRVRGITFDGTDLWITGGADAMTRYNTSGVEQATVDLSSAWSGEVSMHGIAWDGADLWLTGSVTAELRRFSTTGTSEVTVDLVDVSGGGCAVYSSTVYVVDRANDRLRTFDLSGTEGTPVSISECPINPHGLWISASGELYVSQDGVGVYKRLATL